MTHIPKEIAIDLNELTRLEHLVSSFSLLPHQPVNSVLSGKHASKLRGRGLDFSEVRKYVHGDDIRNIDWKVTARTKTTHTKVFNEEKERPSFIIVDQSSSMFFASKGKTKSVIAAEIAAIAGFKVLKAGDRVGGLVFNDEAYDTVQPKRSRKNLMHLLEHICHKNMQLTKREFVGAKQDIINQVLFKAKNMITHDYVVVVISDFEHLNQTGYQHLISIAKHNDVVAVLISDDMEKELPDTKIPVSNGEYQVLLKNKTETKHNFKQITAELHDTTITSLRKYGIPCMEFNTHKPLHEQIKNVFGKA